MMDINVGLLQGFIYFLKRKLLVAVLKVFLIRISRRITQTNYYKKKIKEKYTHLL